MGELRKILHIEDDPGILEIAKISLTVVAGFEVEQAENGQKGLEIVEAFDPDLILIDVQMPGLSGPDTLDRIREIPGFERIPAIYMTAKLMGVPEGELSGPYNLGIIAKPFDPTGIGNEIRALWEGRADAAA